MENKIIRLTNLYPKLESQNIKKKTTSKFNQQKCPKRRLLNLPISPSVSFRAGCVRRSPPPCGQGAGRGGQGPSQVKDWAGHDWARVYRARNFLLSPNLSLIWNLIYVRARAEPISELPLPSKPKPSAAGISHLLLSPNQSQLKYPTCFRAKAKPGLGFLFVTEPSQARTAQNF